MRPFTYVGSLYGAASIGLSIGLIVGACATGIDDASTGSRSIEDEAGVPGTDAASTVPHADGSSGKDSAIMSDGSASMEASVGSDAKASQDAAKSADASPDISAVGGGAELCNGKDDDGNGKIDEIFQCAFNATNGPSCVSSCGTSGQRVCDGLSCSWGSCKPFAEGCSNTIDDDCNGLVDCADPACASASACESGVGMALIHLTYSGPAGSGLIVPRAWWEVPGTAPHAWGPIPGCTDMVSGDGKLDCTFLLPHGTAPFEFQLDLPNGGYWGDASCNPLGGCGGTVGTVTLTAQGLPLTITLVPNNPNGQPYYNGRVTLIP